MKLTEAQQNAVTVMKNSGWTTARELNVAGSTMKGLVTKGLVEQRRDGMYRLKQKRSMIRTQLMNTISRMALVQGMV